MLMVEPILLGGGERVFPEECLGPPAQALSTRAAEESATLRERLVA